MVAAWLLTMPAAGAMGALAEVTVSRFSDATAGVAVVGTAAAAILVTFIIQARRHGNVTADNVIEAEPATLQQIGASA